MNKKIIIKKAEEYTKIIKKNKLYKNEYFSIYINLNQEKKKRFGISVPKKIGNAVVRNKTKRQIKEIIRKRFLEIKTGLDYIIILKNKVLTLTFQEKEEALMNLLFSIGKRK